MDAFLGIIKRQNQVSPILPLFKIMDDLLKPYQIFTLSFGSKYMALPFFTLKAE
jgi:hypothetical protein